MHVRRSTAVIRIVMFAVVVIIASLSACSSSEPPDTPDPDPQSPIDQTPSNPAQDVFISGRISFDKVPHRESNNALNFAATEVRAGRGLTVQLLDGSGVLLRETVSDENGNYLIGAPRNTAVQIRVLAELEKTGNASWQIQVTDNTDNNALYAMAGSLTSSGASDSVRDLHAASGWVDDEYNAPRVAAPFAILDSIYSALSLLESADPTISLAPAEIRWSENNIPVAGDTSIGEISTSYFDPYLGHIFLLGAADNDTDEYDSSVITHEFAHLLEHQLFRIDNIGGSHFGDDLLDMRTAFSEGWGNAFSGMVLGKTTYQDSYGANQDLGFAISLEEIETGALGWFSEGSVHNILFDIFDAANESNDNLAAGFAPIYHTLSSSAFVRSRTMVGIHLFSDVLLNQLTAAQRNAYNALLSEHQIFSNNALASTETNNGGNADALPVYLELSVGNNIQVCTNNNDGEWNKLGNRRFIWVDFPDVSERTVSVTVSDRDDNTAQIWVDYFREGIFLGDSFFETSGTASDTFTPNEAGVHILELYDVSNIDDDFNSFTGNYQTGGEYCVLLSVQ